MAFTRSEAKPAALISILRSLFGKQKTIVFVATRHHVDFLGSLVEKANVARVACIYGSLEQTVRTAALNRFRSGDANVLIVTDVAARGIDIPDVDNVVHYDFPCSPKLFIHRSGRTARAGKSGLCFSIVTQSDMPYLMDLMMFIGAKLMTSSNSNSATIEQTEAQPDEDGMVVEIEEDGSEGAKPERQIEIGAIPLVDEDVELVTRLLDEDPELESGKRSMDLSMGPYFKTRPSASKQAVKKAHDFVNTICGGQQKLLGIPLSLLGSVAQVPMDDGREAILEQLRSFRPSSQTKMNGTNISAVKLDTRKALEQRVYSSKRARELAATMFAADKSDDLLEESEGEEVVQPVAPIKKKDFRSKQFFHAVGSGDNSLTGAGGLDEIEAHKMDLVPETHDELNARARFGKKWDPKKMKYVTVRIGSDGKAIKNESGKKMSKKDMEKGKLLYKEWSKKSKKRIQNVGEVEVDNGGYKKGRRTDSKSADDKKISKIEIPKSVNSKQYHGDVPWQFLTNKQKRLETRRLKAGTVTSRGHERNADTLKTPQSIAKARNLKATRQTLQNPKKRKEFHKQSKDAYMKKQESKIRAKGAPGKSWVKGQKPLGRR
jgi:ATP-dependent RNA helicase DDX54/DBP10